ncbi:armadillo-type protein [Rhypophila decipiens]
MATMDDHVAQLLANTQLNEEAPRQQAEIDLKNLRTNPEYPLALLRIGSHTAVGVNIRQAALTTLRKVVEENWSPEGGDGPHIPITDVAKEALRQGILELVLGPEPERKLKVAASYVVSKIAMVDFPSQWPALLPSVLSVMPQGTDAQLHGALRILQDLVEESLSDEQFFSVARDIISACHDVATNPNRKETHRALAVLVFRSCFDLMDIVKEDHKKEVRQFADEVLKAWLPFLELVISTPLPPQTENDKADGWYGPIALKVQAVKTLIKVKNVFKTLLLPKSFDLFSATWQELARVQPSYQGLFIDSDAQGRLEDIDGLPFTLDFLVLEELDFLNQCVRASPVQKQLESQVVAHGTITHTPWALDLMKLLVAYSQITQEEEGLWDIDVSLYLAEETSVSSSYTARTACGDVIIKIGEWLKADALEALWAYTTTLFAPGNAGDDWRKQEAALYLFTGILRDFLDVQKPVPEHISHGYLGLVQYAIDKHDSPILKARGFIAAGTLAITYPPASTLFERTILAITSDESELVQVSCVKAVEGFIEAGAPIQHQASIISAIKQFLDHRDMDEIEEADDLLVTLLETLRTTICMDLRIAITPNVPAIDLLFLIAKHGAANFQVNMIVTETFEEIVRAMGDPHSYTLLCERVVPSIIGAFDVANITQDDPLVTLSAEILVYLVEYGTEPLPAGFVSALLPKLNKLLMTSIEGDVLRPGAEALKYMLRHDHQQVFAWHDEQNHTGLECTLRIIDRLLSSSIEDNAASEVGGLAAELVEKAGPERLGPFLAQLLQAVAARLDTAQTPTLIQSLIIVFARLSLETAQDVVNFLADIQINGQSGLQVVLAKWLENSINFAGYDEIRQNVIALSKLYALNDPRIAQTNVKGDLIVPESNTIMTRSRARANPDQYTIVPATLKILKVLITELLGASGAGAAPAVAAAAATQLAEDAEDDDGDDDGWEDEPDTLDLSLGSTRADLNLWLDDSPMSRRRDDETQRYLSDFFLNAAKENVFQDVWYPMLTDDEKVKLQELATQ